MQPLVSIVMPTLNQRRFIEQSIRSVLDQGYARIELIVADGNSTDGTQDLLTQVAGSDRRLRWWSQRDEGPASALNKALASVRGTIVGWLNSDDVYAPNAIERVVREFEEHPGQILVYGHGDVIDGEGQVVSNYPTLPPTTPVEAFSDGCFVCQPTVFFRRSMWLLLGKLDEALLCSFDFDYWLRAFLQFHGRIGFIEAVLASSRHHVDTRTARMRRQVAVEGIKILHRHLGHAPETWIVSYAEELLRKAPADRPEGCILSHLQELVEQCSPWLDSTAISNARHRIGRLVHAE